MTPEERAAEIMDWFSALYRGSEAEQRDLGGWSGVSAKVADAIRVAVAEEREACAKIADVKVERPWPETAVEAAKEIAARIRARSEPKPAQQALCDPDVVSSFVN